MFDMMGYNQYNIYIYILIYIYTVYIYTHQYNHLTLLGFNIDMFGNVKYLNDLNPGFAVPRERRRSLAPSSRRLGAVAEEQIWCVNGWVHTGGWVNM